MAEIELLMPKMGESVAEATITKWLKDIGENVDEDEFIVEIATDKVDSEIPSTTAGTLVKKLYEEGDVVQVGDAIAVISTTGEVATVSEKPSSTSVSSSSSIEEKIPHIPQETTEVVPLSKTGSNGQFFSPLVRNIAKQENISVGELESISGSGMNGRITKKDILTYIENKNTETSPNQAQSAPAKITPTKVTQPKNIPAKNISLGEGDEIIEMDRMRKLIADHMVMSKQTSPHVTSFVEADVTNMVNWRNKWKNEFFSRESEKLTFTPLFIEAIVRAIKDFPMVNVSVNGNQIIKKKNINIGMATALPSGNLIVPVIKNADQLNLTGITRLVNDLANRARNNALKPDEVQGGTYTVTNVGSFGNIMGTPIINQPQVGILALGAIVKKPAVIETPEGDFIGIRHKMFLSHSYDHRVVDGALGGRFVRKVADYLEQFDITRNI